VCGLHRARGDEEREFFDRASKAMSTVCQWFCLKTTGTICQWFDLKNTEMVSSGLTSIPVATVSSGLALKSMDLGFLV
jgi:hypothetical protein